MPRPLEQSETRETVAQRYGPDRSGIGKEVGTDVCHRGTSCTARVLFGGGVAQGRAVGNVGSLGRAARAGALTRPASPQLYLRELLRLTHLRFYQHLVALGEDGLQMLFCHRWLLLCFKREFPEAEALRIWEACWAHYQVSRGSGAAETTPQSAVAAGCHGNQAPPRGSPSSETPRSPTSAPSGPHAVTASSSTWLAPDLRLTSQGTEIDAGCLPTVLITTLRSRAPSRDNQSA